MQNPEDRRRAVRVDVIGKEVKCTGPGVHGVYTVSNMSRGGALLLGGPTPRIGSTIEMELGPDWEEPIIVTAQAVRHGCSPVGHKTFGVSFERIPSEAQKMISGTLRKQTERLYAPTVLVAVGYGWPGKMLVNDLRLSGCRTVVVSSYARALEALSSPDISISVAVIEEFRPQFRGLATAVANWFPDIKRVMMTGPIIPRGYGKALTSGLMDAAVVAPWTIQSLRETLRLPKSP